jgi:hypothetical protein
VIGLYSLLHCENLYLHLGAIDSKKEIKILF